MGDFNALAQHGGFALLAAVCVWAIVAVVKIGVTQMERGHLREIEGIKLLASDRAQLLQQSIDVMLEVRTALVSLQDEIASITRSTARQDARQERKP